MQVIALLVGVWSAGASASLRSDWPYVENKLSEAGFASAFIQAAHAAYEPEAFAKVLELNTLLFLRKTDYHGPQVSPGGALEVRQFVERNADGFAEADARYHVSPPVIASLLWMESRFGQNQGSFHVVSAFIDLLQADRPANIRELGRLAVPKYTARLTKKDRRGIAKRGRKRAKWALDELRALAQMAEQDQKLVRGLRGSFAGAFGLPQFEPSSYVRYARSRGPGAPDLGQPGDAILSVAHYLCRSGWRADRPKSFERALLKYNHSHDYARAILNLADLSDRRAPSSTR